MPLYGLQLMKRVIGGLFPELTEIGFTDSRVRLRLRLEADHYLRKTLLTGIPAVLVHGQHR